MLETHENVLRGLTDPLSTALFRRPSRIGVESAWYGHVPFAMWIVQQAQPQVLVELGTHAGVSYSAFCDAVLENRLTTRCFAIDTWKGDEHAGFYDEKVYEDFQRFHDLRYQAFSRMLRMTFDEALGQMPDGSIDLLHIDGLHSYEAVKHDFESWLPKLTDRAIVLFHDTNVRERGFGVWQLWRQLSQTYPAFEFLHCNGLGVLGVGRDLPSTIEALCALGQDAAVTDLRERFALLGERWHCEARMMLLQAGVDRMWTDIQAKETASQAAWTVAETARKSHERERDAAIKELRQTHAVLAVLRRERDAFRQERDLLLNSTSWRALGAARRVATVLPLPLRRAIRRSVGGVFRLLSRQKTRLPPNNSTPRIPARPGTQPRDSILANPMRRDRRVVFISGEAHTPGHEYRVLRYNKAAAAISAKADWFALEDYPDHREVLLSASIVILWRAANSPATAAVIQLARSASARILFDIDDLIFLPEIANGAIIDGIRSENHCESETAALFLRFREVMEQADACLCTTRELADQVRQIGMVAYILPNGFDYDSFAVARSAVRQWRAGNQDGLTRIGYAAGSRTHQRDFAIAAGSIARVLTEYKDCRLVLFRAPGSGRALLNIDEFHDFNSLRSQIEWRDMVPLSDLPNELSRFDINLIPLETGNIFCECKSELKYFEAALVDVCTVASPTGPMARAIRHGETGLLANNSDEWHKALSDLVRSVDLRRRLASAAFVDVLNRFGPNVQQDCLALALQEIEGSPGSNQALQTNDIQQESYRHQAPEIPPSEVLFSADGLKTANVTVIIPLHNYANYILEALDSVRRQTLHDLDVIVVDDASTDRSAELAVNWMREHATRFNRAMVLRNNANAGLALTRNAGFNAADTAFVLPLDADNTLRPQCCEICLDVLRRSSAGFAYPIIQTFGDSSNLIGTHEFLPARFIAGNYIDAMALVGKWAWLKVGGYIHIKYGWEDYDFWCRCVEHGIGGVHVPNVLADYRVHKASMLHTMTDIAQNKEELINDFESRHPWLRIARPPA